VKEATGWDLAVSPGLQLTAAPSEQELQALRQLLATRPAGE